MRNTPNWIPERIDALPGGMNKGLDPGLLDPDQFEDSFNLTVRGGLVTTRPAFRRIQLNWPNDDEASFHTRFQRALAYQGDDGKCAFLVMTGGRLWRINPTTFNVSDASGGNLQRSDVELAWGFQAENYAIWNDGSSLPVFYDGAMTRRSAGQAGTELLPGRAGAYVNGRVWYSRPTGRTFRAGDLVFGASGSVTTGRRDAVLKETENTFLNEGGEFSVPQSGPPINAMIYLPQLDTSLGQGPLMVFTSQSVFSVNSPADRTVWKEVTYPIQTIGLLSDGALSPNGVVQVNGDLWFRGVEGIQSFLLARRQFTDPGQSPKSFEVDKILDKDTEWLLQNGSAVYWKKRLLTTISPVRDNDFGIYHRGLVSLDFAPVSSLKGNLAPAWEGRWTGLKIFQVLTCLIDNKSRCFIFAFNDTEGKIELWEVRDDEFADNNLSQDISIPWSLTTRRYWFGDSKALHDLKNSILWADLIYNQVDVTLSYRPDSLPCWFTWGTKSVCATTEICGEVLDQGCIDLKNLHPGFKPRAAYGQPPNDALPGFNLARIGFGHQFRLDGTGFMRLRGMLFYAEPKPEATFGVASVQ